jgi:hypothetical protein
MLRDAKRPTFQNDVGTRAALARIAPGLATAFFLSAAAFYALTTLSEIVNFAWRQPIYDQWRMYSTFLGMPFPQNIVQLENGHRPIVPNLIRVAEIHWFGANQMLQIGVGTTCLFLTWTAIVTTIWRQENVRVVFRSAETLLATLGLLWLANARMLLHGNESLHVYLLMLSLVLAALLAIRARDSRSIVAFGLATLACVVAVFCFGPGIATLPALLCVAVALRLPARWLLLPIGAAAFCLSTYFVLPGHERVSQMLTLRPLDSLTTAAQWLASPWVNGWLGFADPPLYDWMQGAAPGTEFLGMSANAATAATSLQWRTLATLLGLGGMFGFLLRVGMALRGARVSTLEAILLSLGLFALTTACVIGIGRLDYLRVEHPEEIFSNRYLVWPCLFWMSFSIWLVHDLARRSALVKSAVCAACALLAIVLLPTQYIWAQWGAIVYRGAQQTAAALRSNALDPQLLPLEPPVNRDARLAIVEKLRTSHLATFADNAWTLVGTKWSDTIEHRDDCSASLSIANAVRGADGVSSAHFAGQVDCRAAELNGRQLALLDGTGTIAGLAEFSYVSPPAAALRIGIARKHGFDGYVAGFDPLGQYSLVAFSFGAGPAILLGSVNPQN